MIIQSQLKREKYKRLKYYMLMTSSLGSLGSDVSKQVTIDYIFLVSK